MSAKKFNAIAIASIVTLGIVLPYAVLLSGSAFGLFADLIVARFSPLIALGAAVSGLITLYRGEKSSLAHVLMPAATATVFVFLAFLGVFANFAHDTTEAVVYFILSVHVIVPLVSATSAVAAIVAKKKGYASAKNYASVALYSAFLMVALYGSIYLTR